MVASADENVFVDGIRQLPTSDGSYAVRQDSTLTVVCSFNGVANEDVAWSKDGLALSFTRDDRLIVTSSSDSSKLVIRNAEAGDSGEYVCRGGLDGETVASSVQITTTGTTYTRNNLNFCYLCSLYVQLPIRRS